METIGLFAGGLYVILGVLCLLPVFFIRALYKTYQDFCWATFIDDLPHWRAYAVMTTLVLLFWFVVILIINLCL